MIIEDFSCDKRGYKVRLLIDNEKKKDVMYPLPWDSDGICFNFRKPTKTILPNTAISNPEKVETLVINCNLTNYGFISSLVNLTQLYIYKGENLNDLSFIKNLTKLTQLCILESHVDTLDNLVELINLKYRLYKKYPKEQEHIGRFMYGFEGVYIQSDSYFGDGREMIQGDVCRTEIITNSNRLTPEDIFTNPEYRKLLYKDD